MAYASSVNAPYLLSWGNLAPANAGTIGGGLVSNSSIAVVPPRLWGYLTTADALTTVTASSYFSDGWNRGMRPGDIVHISNSTSTTSSTGVTVTRAVVTAYSSATGGVNLTTGNIQN